MKHKNQKWKNVIICLALFVPRVMVMKMRQMAHLFVFSADDSKNSYNLGKVFKCIRKVLFSCFSNCYGLLGSELPLAKCQPLKIRDLGIFCWLSRFSDISILIISRTVTLKPIDHSIFWNDSIRPLRCIK